MSYFLEWENLKSSKKINFKPKLIWREVNKSNLQLKLSSFNSLGLFKMLYFPGNISLIQMLQKSFSETVPLFQIWPLASVKYGENTSIKYSVFQ